MIPIPKIDSITPEVFNNEILPHGRPVVIRGMVRDWPIVQAALTSNEAFCRYLKRFDRGYDLDTAFGTPSIGGRLFYNDDLSGFNFRTAPSKLSSSLDYLIERSDENPPPALAIQSVAISRYFPGLELENRLRPGFMPEGIEPKLWLGNRITVAAHFDSSENIACCVAGSRRFTLFPPEQVANLYVGPFEHTPAGATISMVDFDRPDYAKYPRFKQAEAAAHVADLAPGDAIYIPYLWWHNVRSLEKINALINYWWGQADEQRGTPRNALLHAMMSVKCLPPSHRDAWRKMFEHYVFETNGKPGAHLPEPRQGILGDLKPDMLKILKTTLIKFLSRS
jgi:hypothetical protein